MPDKMSTTDAAVTSCGLSLIFATVGGAENNYRIKWYISQLDDKSLRYFLSDERGKIKQRDKRRWLLTEAKRRGWEEER